MNIISTSVHLLIWLTKLKVASIEKELNNQPKKGIVEKTFEALGARIKQYF